MYMLGTVGVFTVSSCFAQLGLAQLARLNVYMYVPPSVYSIILLSLLVKLTLILHYALLTLIMKIPLQRAGNSRVSVKICKGESANLACHVGFSSDARQVSNRFSYWNRRCLRWTANTQADWLTQLNL